MEASKEAWKIHVGRGWADTLGAWDEQRALRLTPGDAYAVSAFVDLVGAEGQTLALPRVVRVVPFALAFVDQLVRAGDDPTRSFSVDDGAELFRIQRRAEVVTLHGEFPERQVPLDALRHALSALLCELQADLQELHTGGSLLPVIRHLALGDALLTRDATAPRATTRRRRRLYQSPSLDLRDAPRSVASITPTRVETVESLLRRAPEASTPAAATPAPPPIAHLHFLSPLQHVRDVDFISTHASDVFLGNTHDLLLLFPEKIVVADTRLGTHWELSLDITSEHGAPKRLDDAVIVPAVDALYALLPGDRWTTLVKLEGAYHSDDVASLVASPVEALAYLRRHTVYDAPTGAAVLHEVSRLFPRRDAAGQVVGWYALDRERETLWWDGEGTPRVFHRSDARIITAASTRHGLLTLSHGDKLPVIRWLTHDAEVAWERPFETRGEGYTKLRFLTWPAQDDGRLCFALVAGHVWWAFGVHTRTRLATLVLHHREQAAVRVEWGEGALVVASGERLRAYPVEGRMPEPLWEEVIPNELGLLAPVFPVHIQGELLVHATSAAVVRRLRTGEVLAEYRGAWTAVFDVRLDRQFGVSVIGAVPGSVIEIFRAEATHWLGLVLSEE